MADRVSTVLLRYLLDRAALSQTEQETRRFQRFVQKTGEELRKAFSSAPSRLSDLAIETKRTADGFDELRQSINRAAEEQDRFLNQRSQFSRGASTLSSAFSSAASLAGGGSASEALRVVDNLVGTLGQLPRFSQGVRDIAAGLQAAPGILGNVASQGAAMAGSLGSVLAVAGPAVVALGAVSIAFAKFNEGLEAAKRVLDAATRANQTYYELLGSGATSDEVQQQLDQLRQQNEAAKAELASIENAFASGFQSYADAHGDFIARLVYGASQITNVDDELTARADELRVTIAENEQTIGRLDAALQNNSFSANDAAQAQEELAEAQARAAEAAARQLAQLRAQRDQLLENFRLQQQQIAQDRALRDSREKEDEALRATAARERALSQIEAAETASALRIVQIRDDANRQLLKLDQNFLRESARARAQAIKAIERVNRDADREDAKARERARKEEARIEAQFRKEQRRALQDHNRSLQDAERANDVIAFIAEQERFATEQQRRQEDYDDEKRLRQEQYEEEQREREEQRRQRIEDIRAAAEEERLLREQQLDEQKAALIEQARERILAEQEQTRARIAEIKAGYIEEQRLADEARRRRLDRQAEDDKIADQRRLDALNRQLADLDARMKAELDVLRKTTEQKAAVERNAAAQTASAIQTVFIAAINVIAARAAALFAYNAYGGLGAKPKAFAEGGIVTRPTPAILGERGPEAIVPLINKSEGLGTALARYGLRGQSGPLVSISGITIHGDGVTMPEVEVALNKLGATIIRGIQQARNPA